MTVLRIVITSAAALIVVAALAAILGGNLSSPKTPIRDEDADPAPRVVVQQPVRTRPHNSRRTTKLHAYRRPMSQLGGKRAPTASTATYELEEPEPMTEAVPGPKPVPDAEPAPTSPATEFGL
jgi:hypothetical protein